jgi:hypothetical protein
LTVAVSSFGALARRQVVAIMSFCNSSCWLGGRSCCCCS